MSEFKEQCRKIKLDAVLEHMRRYQHNVNPEDFAIIQEHLDELLVYLSIKVKNIYDFLSGVTLTEVYHYSLGALHDSIRSLPEQFDSKYIPCRIEAYLKAVVKQTYKYVNKEYPASGMIKNNEQNSNVTHILDSLNSKREQVTDRRFNFDFQHLRTSKLLTRFEYEVLMLIVDGKPASEIARIKKIPYGDSLNAVKKLKVKVKDILKNDINILYRGRIDCDT